MACERIQNIGENTQTPYIKKTLQLICQMQREASLPNQCEGCLGGLVQAMYNTKPVSIYFSTTNILNIALPQNPTLTTDIFRVENVINDCVILRLLQRDATTSTITCTNYTCIVNINCICALQCFDPICCEECTRTCGAQTTQTT